MTNITREAVEARVEWLMQMAAVHANEFAAGMEDSADMLFALLARAESAERERDEAERCSEAHGKERVFWKDKAEAAERDRDRLAGELAEAKRAHKNAAANGYDISQRNAALTADLATAQKTIEEMRKALARVYDKTMDPDVSEIARAALAQANKTEGM